MCRLCADIPRHRGLTSRGLGVRHLAAGAAGLTVLTVAPSGKVRRNTRAKLEDVPEYGTAMIYLRVFIDGLSRQFVGLRRRPRLGPKAHISIGLQVNFTPQRKPERLGHDFVGIEKVVRVAYLRVGLGLIGQAHQLKLRRENVLAKQAGEGLGEGDMRCLFLSGHKGVM